MPWESAGLPLPTTIHQEKELKTYTLRQVEHTLVLGLACHYQTSARHGESTTARNENNKS